MLVRLNAGIGDEIVDQRLLIHPHVLDDDPLPPKGLPEGVARRVIRPVAHRHRPLHHGADPLAEARDVAFAHRKRARAGGDPLPPACPSWCADG